MGSMNQVREALPEPFAPGPEVWSEVIRLATELLTAWGQRLLSATPEFDEDVDIPGGAARVCSGAWLWTGRDRRCPRDRRDAAPAGVA